MPVATVFEFIFHEQVVNAETTHNSAAMVQTGAVTRPNHRADPLHSNQPRQEVGAHWCHDRLTLWVTREERVVAVHVVFIWSSVISFQTAVRRRPPPQETLCFCKWQTGLNY